MHIACVLLWKLTANCHQTLPTINSFYGCDLALEVNVSKKTLKCEVKILSLNFHPTFL